ncbi:MAG: Rieske 2Fe-2S domain-containing protein [Ignavibacteria bacterium]|jgi:NAD(P)H-dependent nitrite reductase small subunit
MSDNGFFKVCKVDELKEGEGKRFLVDDVDVAVFKVDGKIYALSNICPHQKTALMYDGYIENGKVGCPVHGWEFDLETGNLGKGRGLQSYKVKIKNDEVFVKVTKKDYNW